MYGCTIPKQGYYSERYALHQSRHFCYGATARSLLYGNHFNEPFASSVGFDFNRTALRVLYLMMFGGRIARPAVLSTVNGRFRALHHLRA